jgi:hypothetical protein
VIDIEALARDADKVFPREGIVESQWCAAFANAVLEAALAECIRVRDPHPSNYEFAAGADDCIEAITALKVKQ